MSIMSKGINEGSKGIYNKKSKHEGIQCEIKQYDVEDKIVKMLSEKISLILFGYGTANIGEKLLIEILEEEIKDILREYQSYCADKMSQRIKNTFNLESEINDGYALHAKLADITDELEKKFNEKTK